MYFRFNGNQSGVNFFFSLSTSVHADCVSKYESWKFDHPIKGRTCQIFFVRDSHQEIWGQWNRLVYRLLHLIHRRAWLNWPAFTLSDAVKALNRSGRDLCSTRIKSVVFIRKQKISNFGLLESLQFNRAIDRRLALICELWPPSPFSKKPNKIIVRKNVLRLKQYSVCK